MEKLPSISKQNQREHAMKDQLIKYVEQLETERVKIAYLYDDKTLEKFDALIEQYYNLINTL